MLVISFSRLHIGRAFTFTRSLSFTHPVDTVKYNHLVVATKQPTHTSIFTIIYPES